MGRKYDEAIERVNGIRENLEVAAADVSADADGMMRYECESMAMKVDMVLKTVVMAIDGKLSDESDYDVAKGLVSSVLVVDSFERVLRNL